MPYKGSHIHTTVPLVKKASVSGFYQNDEGENVGFYLDGHCNPGFSGGPCLSPRSDKRWNIFGIASFYIPQEEVLYDEDQRSRMVLFENSGIFICYNIGFIIRAIEKAFRSNALDIEKAYLPAK